jgi:hypothetical protein
MRRMSSRLFTSLLVLPLLVTAAPAQSPVPQTQEDDYTRYELLAPDTAQFRIYYEVTATTPGARFFFNVIRKGSVATDERVVDLSTGQPLKWEVVAAHRRGRTVTPPRISTPSGSRCTWRAPFRTEGKPAS